MRYYGIACIVCALVLATPVQARVRQHRLGGRMTFTPVRHRTHRPVRSPAPVVVPPTTPTPPPAVGFYCNGSAACDQLEQTEQILIGAPDPSLGCGGQLQPMMRNGQRVGAYVDDTLGAQTEMTDQQCANQEGLFAWAGMAIPGGTPGYDWQSPAMPLGLAEWYPILTDTQVVPAIPPPGAGGYFMQSFTWEGSSLESCSGGCEAPTFDQEHTMWCEALAQHPKAIFWFPATDTTIPLDLEVEQTPCV